MDNQEIEKQAIQKFLTIVSSTTWYEEHKSTIHNAIKLAQKAHQGQVRKLTEEPYITHPLAVATKVAQKTNDPLCVIAAIIHDTAEDNSTITLDIIYDTFGSTVGFLVDSVTDTVPFFLKDKKIICADKIEKILAGGLKNIGSIMIKIADREHNLETIDGLDPSKQVRMNFESQAIYVPLKKILDYDNPNATLASCEEKFIAYCKKNKTKSATTLKRSLINQMYTDFDNDSFIYAYSHSKRVMRNVQDKVLFYEMANEPAFGSAIDIMRMEQRSDKYFMVEFVFIMGTITSDDANLDMGGYTTS